MIKHFSHNKIEIPKGIYGELLKIEEEIYELIDAESKNDLNLCFHKLSDIFCAFEGYINKYYPDYDAIDLCTKFHRPQNDDCGKDLLEAFNKLLKYNKNITDFSLSLFGNKLVYVLCNNDNYKNFDIHYLKASSDKTKLTKI